MAVVCLGLTWIRVDVAKRSPGAWGRMQKSNGASDLQEASEGASGVEIHRFLCC